MSKKRLVYTVLIALALSGCEQVFRYSPVEFLQRDPSSLSEQAKVSYAESALTSGNRDAMKSAFDALKDTEDNSVKVLAAEVGVGASGLNDAVDTLASAVTGSLSQEEITTSIEEVIDSLDESTLSESGRLLKEASDAGANISRDTYIAVTVGLLDGAVKRIAADISSVNPTDASSFTSADTGTQQAAQDDVTLALELAEAGGLSTEDFTALFGQ